MSGCWLRGFGLPVRGSMVLHAREPGALSPFFSARPQVFAHRGGCALGPENTIAAFDVGMSTGADGLELDVHLSADNVVVVHHDRTLDRTTNATGPVAARTADELARVDAGYRFARGGEYPFRGRGIGVPTLREVLGRYRGVPTIIEIKVYTTAMGRAVADEILAVEDRVLQTRAAEAVANHPFHAVLVHFDAGEAAPIFGVEPFVPEIGGLVSVTIAGDHQVAIGIGGTRGTVPSGVAGGFQSPSIRLIDCRCIHCEAPFFARRDSSSPVY